MSMKLRAIGPVLLAVAAGCGGSRQSEEVRDAHMEIAEARADAQREQNEQRSEQKQEAIDQRYDQRAERLDQRDPPAEDARQELLDVSRERAEFQARARARLNRMATRINEADSKLQILGGQAPLPLKQEVQTAAKSYAGIKDDVTHLDRTPAERWEQTTRQIQSRSDELESRLDDIEERIEDHR